MSVRVERGRETEKLISDLLVRAGVLMEDFSAECVSTLPDNAQERRSRVRQLGLGGLAIGALALAAWALTEAAEPVH